MANPSAHCERIRNHYDIAWGCRGTVKPFLKGPGSDLGADFAVLEFAPRGDRRMWTYATCCMSRQSDESPIELHVFSADKSEEIVELLVVVAHYHRTGARLDLWHTVNFGKPWRGRSLCSFGLISLPYLDGPDVQSMTADSGKSVNFYWMIPVTFAEVQYKKENGIEALESRLEEENFNYLDLGRASVC